MALAQAEETRKRLTEAHPGLAAPEIVVIRTTGDRIRDRALSELGGKGLFTKEIDEALLDGRVDIAVHSMKDVPTLLPDGLSMVCLLPREDARDALFTPIDRPVTSLAALPEGAVLGTASLRRQAQVLVARPDIEITLLRGNVETRLRKLEDGAVDATMLAVAGLRRLGMSDRIGAILAPEEMLPAVGQGAVGIAARTDDKRARDALAPLNHSETEIRVSAERACLETLDGSCRTPIAAYAEIRNGDSLRFRALIARPDGSDFLAAERRGTPSDAMAIGADAGAELLRRAGPGYLAT